MRRAPDRHDLSPRITVAIGLGLAVLTRPSAALKLEAAVHGSGSAIVGAAEPPTELEGLYSASPSHTRGRPCSTCKGSGRELCRAASAEPIVRTCVSSPVCSLEMRWDHEPDLPALSFLSRPLFGGRRVLQTDSRCRGSHGYALQGQPGEAASRPNAH